MKTNFQFVCAHDLIAWQLSKIIFACCVLHNFCIFAGDEWDDENANYFDNDDQADDGNILRDGDEIQELLKNLTL